MPFDDGMLVTAEDMDRLWSGNDMLGTDDYPSSDGDGFDRTRARLHQITAPPAVRGIESASEFLRKFEPPAYVLEPIALKKQVVSITAQPGGGKTTVSNALVLATTGLANIPGFWLPKPGRVLYLQGENEVAYSCQLLAACARYGVRPGDLDGKLWVLARRAPLKLLCEEIADRATEVGGFDLIVVDTKIAYSASAEENQNNEAADDAVALRALTNVLGSPAVIVLCHPAKNAVGEQMVPRGGGAFLGEIDGNLGLTQTDGGVKMAIIGGKFRAPEFEPITWAIEPQDIGIKDQRGRPMQSVVAVRIDDGVAARAAEAARSYEDVLLGAMKLNPGASISDLALACSWPSTAKSRVHRTMKRLLSDKLVRMHRGTYRLTPAGEKEVSR
jgi:hypothetical protein